MTLLAEILAGVALSWVARVLYSRWRKWHICAVRQDLTFEEFKKGFADTDYADAAIRMEASHSNTANTGT